MSDYKFTEEYRDRNSFNEGDIYWITEAFNSFTANVRKELETVDQPIITADFIDRMFEELMWKVESWTDKRPVLDDDEA